MWKQIASGKARFIRVLVVGLLGTATAAALIEPLTSKPAGAAVLVGITVSPTTASVAAGDTQQFTATGHYLGGTTTNLTDSVTWSSSSTGTATVSNAAGSQGLATGVATGAATITATDPSSLIDGTALLAVTPAVLVGITVSPTTASVAAGDTQQFTATGLYSNLTTTNLTDSVTWSSSSTGTATVSNAAGSQGLATGVATGAATITATDPSSLIDGTALLAVTPAVLVGITVSPTTASVAAGDTQQFTATGLYSNLTTTNLTDSVTWSSSSTGTATVSNAAGSQGLATGVATGAATITATDPSSLIDGTALLAVTPAVLVGITVSPTTASVAAGDTQQFTATGLYSNLTTTNLTDSVTWSSSSTGTATVSNAAGSQGLATGVATGAATITATDPSSLIDGTALLAVTPAVLVGITVSPTTASVAAGDTQQFTATGLYSNLTTTNLTDSVTWSSSSTGTATVSNAAGSQGLATGVATGAATITATDPSSLIDGTALLAVISISPSMTVTPSSGPKRTAVAIAGANFVPGRTVTVTYMSTHRSTPLDTVLCTAMVTLTGKFSCSGSIPRGRAGGKRGPHSVVASPSSGSGAQATFTLTKRVRKKG